MKTILAISAVVISSNIFGWCFGHQVAPLLLAYEKELEKTSTEGRELFDLINQNNVEAVKNFISTEKGKELIAKHSIFLHRSLIDIRYLYQPVHKDIIISLIENGVNLDIQTIFGHLIKNANAFLLALNHPYHEKIFDALIKKYSNQDLIKELKHIDDDGNNTQYYIIKAKDNYNDQKTKEYLDRLIIKTNPEYYKLDN